MSKTKTKKPMSNAAILRRDVGAAKELIDSAARYGEGAEWVRGFLVAVSVFRGVIYHEIKDYVNAMTAEVTP